MLKKKKVKERFDQIYKAAEECTQLVNKNQPQKLINFLRSLPKDIKINQIVDRDGYSILHMACFSNRVKCLVALVEKAKGELYQYEIAEWVNLKTAKDEFTALHYASFKGNIQILQVLMENGADMYQKNMHGLNVLHIAA
jgi:ankyrin repeat protein